MTTEQTIKQLIVEHKGTIYEPVLEDLVETLEDYDTELGYLDMVREYGCSGGFVSRLIYTRDSIAFAKEYNEDIFPLMKESYIEMKLSDYDDLDSLLNDLGWLGYELAARELLYTLDPNA